MIKQCHAVRGFTLIELLLSIAIIGMLAAIGAPAYYSLLSGNSLDTATLTTVQSLRRAQTLSRAVDGDSAWGVAIASSTVVVFKGARYATRDESRDEAFDISTSVTPSGLQEIVFSKFSGEPQVIGTTTLTSSASTTRTIVINAKGTITY